MNSVSDIRKAFAIKFQNSDFEIDKTGVKVIEIIGAQFIADEPFIFGTPNEKYIKQELKWYKSQSLNVNDIENTPKIWKQVADPSGFINSNYGWMIFSKDNGKQYNNCLAELKRNPSTRRATMIYNRPEMWVDYNKRNMSDFCCTYATQFFIRNNILYCLIFMRSQDAVFGYKNDLAWHKYVINKVAKDLNIKTTNIICNSGSLHIYQNQFYLLNHYIKTGDAAITKEKYDLLYNC
ncbi:MAG: thymidylate synthase [Clostridia bacterium]